MDQLRKKRPRKKAIKRKKSGSFNVKRFLSFVVLLLALVFSMCAVGYVIFFRTVVAQEILPALRNAIVFEEPDQPVHVEEPAIKPIKETVVETTVETAVNKKPKLPKVAIIIDDMGYDEVLGNEVLNLPFELTYSFLPFAPFTRKLEKKAHISGKTVFLHLPLEPKDSAFNPGPGALYLHDSPEMQKEKFEKDLQEVPHAVGVNNHMGSAFTVDELAMSNIISQLKASSLVFVDSVTTPASVGLQIARRGAVKSIRRNVFLDNIQDEEKICEKLEQLVQISEKYGRAIGIGHPHRVTVNAVLRCGEKYRGRVEYVGVPAVLW